MVLGLRSRRRKDSSVQLEYSVHVGVIKPWPPSQYLRSVQSVLLQWENGDQNSGSISCDVGDTVIEFNESFTLPLTLSRERKAQDKFQKNYLEFYLYEPRKDKRNKGQLLGTATINLAEYGVIDEIRTIIAPLNCKKSSKSLEQPSLSIRIQPVSTDSESSSPNISLLKETPTDKEQSERIPNLVSEGNDDDLEIASFTDDDVSSHSSMTAISSTFEAARDSPSEYGKSGFESVKQNIGKDDKEFTLSSGPPSVGPEVNVRAEDFQEWHGSPQHTSLDIVSSDVDNQANGRASQFPQRSMSSGEGKACSSFVESSSSFRGFQDLDRKVNDPGRTLDQENIDQDFHEEAPSGQGRMEDDAQSCVDDSLIDRWKLGIRYSDAYIQVNEVSDPESAYSQAPEGRKNGQPEATESSDVQVNPMDARDRKEEPAITEDEQVMKEKGHAPENKLVGQFSQDTPRRESTFRSNSLSSTRRTIEAQGSSKTISKLKHTRSVQDSSKRNMFTGSSRIFEKPLRGHVLQEAHSSAKSIPSTDSKPTNVFSDKKKSQSRIEKLEEELRQAAAIEVSLYTVVAEHGSSSSKVHAPARRLSRFYLHACKARSRTKQVSAARAAASGLVLVSRACGSDVPRLTFWLSNSIILRAILSEAAGEVLRGDGPSKKINVGGTALSEKNLKKGERTFPLEEPNSNVIQGSDDWEDIETFILALEDIEAWIFSRIVESVWWQAITPYMQSTVAKDRGKSAGRSSKKIKKNRSSLGDQEQNNFSIELWKKAFKDACERLCPIRAGGHECGCLPLLTRLVMEQLVTRLDVAMFNAILRESAEEMPADPVSDPICDSKVLPIPVGRASFGAGAQLKNAIGNWSRWLSDIFGMEDNDLPEVSSGDLKRSEPFKVFHLLNALSDFMMLPIEMLADKDARKEVCPTFATSLIKRVLNNFVPDEFCPDPIPQHTLEALEFEDSLEESLTSFPCTSAPIVYSSPAAASVKYSTGEVGNQIQENGSSVLRKSYTSDNELDEVDSPLTSIVAESFRGSPGSRKLNWMPKLRQGDDVVRFQLLRQVWKDDDR